MTPRAGDPRKGRPWMRVRSNMARMLPCPCYRCGQTVEVWHAWHVDHVIPVVNGGGRGPLAVSHARCNVIAGRHVRRSPTAAPSRDW